MFDISLVDNGSGAFDINLGTGGGGGTILRISGVTLANVKVISGVAIANVSRVSGVSTT